MTIPSTPDCCDAWPHIAGRFSWFDLDDQPSISVMPSMLAAGSYWRVNHCPSCGAPRRAAVWNRTITTETTDA